MVFYFKEGENIFLDNFIDNEKSDQVEKKDIFTKHGYKKIMILDFCNTPKSLNEIMAYVKANNKPTFRKNYILPLIESGKLEMTIPDKPSSNKQKYVTKRRDEK